MEAVVKKVPNHGVSQLEMYQMYAYSKKYNAPKIVLLCPQADNFQETGISYQSNDRVNVEVSFIDLL